MVSEDSRPRIGERFKDRHDAPSSLQGADPSAAKSQRPRPAARAGLAWPLPALLAWAGAWAVFGALMALGAAPWLALALATVLATVVATTGSTRWRRALIAGGFPVSLAASGLSAGLAPWAWLLPLALLVSVYPLRSWRDAPLFPTPAGALAGLSRRVPLPPAVAVVDAGCGLGDALRQLRREYPQARLEGWEWSLPLAWISALRCPWARVRRCDLWAADWSAYGMVYLFQRPESMARAVAKARAELEPGAWMASLEFEASGLRAHAVHACADGRRLWLYQAPFRAR